MKKLLVTLIILVVIAVLAITCPGKEEHNDAIMHAVQGYLDKKKTEYKEKDTSILEDIGHAIGGALTSSVSDLYLDKYLEVDKYVVFSLGRIQNIDGKKQCVSVGVLNQVITFNEEDIEEAINDNAASSVKDGITDIIKGVLK